MLVIADYIIRKQPLIDLVIGNRKEPNQLEFKGDIRRIQQVSSRSPTDPLLMFLRMSAAAAPPAPGSRSRERACPPWAARRGRTAPHSSGTDTWGETAICY